MRRLGVPLGYRLGPPIGHLPVWGGEEEEPAFSPADIAGLVLWLKADAITGLVNGDPIATWADSSGNGYDATQATTAHKPSYRTSVINGLPVARFDGVDDRLENTTNSLVAGGAARTVFVVGDGPAAGVTGTLFTFRRTTKIHTLQLYTDGGTSSIYSDGVAVNETISDAESAKFRSPFVASFRYTGSSTVALWLNGVAITVSGGDVVAEDGAAGYTVGYREDAISQGWKEDIAEVIVYDSALSAGDRQLVQTYLGAKYGVTIS